MFSIIYRSRSNNKILINLIIIIKLFVLFYSSILLLHESPGKVVGRIPRKATAYCFFDEKKRISICKIYYFNFIFFKKLYGNNSECFQGPLIF